MSARRTALVIAPGRGTYGKGELGSIARLHGARFGDLIANFDAQRRERGQPTVTELDGAERFSVADAAGYVSLPLVGMATQIVYGRDFLLDAGVDWKSYVKAINSRPAAQRVSEDRKAAVAASRPA